MVERSGPGCPRPAGAQTWQSVTAMHKPLLFSGLAIVLIAFAWPWLSQVRFGRLPGDIVIARENFRFYFPITTMILVSAVVTLLVWIYRQF